ncbi:hypothetical protein Moror_11838 [Moniliophthora roreri MCA 2997]|uniref:Uncharacterized protein n=1 Tax=Moniliophthora roreri (strain MCA 2997) TaxID=1381753 RepID=V2X3Y9_MONRO|nr:hypothetical protein Moror_11838 [Moniliophthora roreri MCA 2997]
MAEFLDSVEGEIAFFRAIMRARPIGRHQSFHIISMRSSIHKDTGHWVTPDHIIHKLRSCYDLDALHAIVRLKELDAEAPDPTPSPSDELSNDPHFKNEMVFPPPDDASYEALIAPRRMRHTPSPPSTPEASESKTKPKSSKKRERGKSKANLAGLVSGDSDSSALTQESGDEGEGVPADSVATATDGETVDGDGEDVETYEPTTPEPSTSTSKSKKRKSTGKRKLSGAAAVNASRAAARKKAAAAAASKK